MKKTVLFILLTIFTCSIIPYNHINAADSNTIESAIKNFADKKSTYRITVSDFKNTSGKITKFDGYIADSIIHQLSKYNNFKLIERQRLNSVINELKLNTTGMINAKQALKIGNLLPVDLIGTGSYTIIGSKIQVNGRFISVVTGEIIHTIAYSFDADEKTDVPVADNKSLCEKKQDDVIYKLKNLNGKENINKAVQAAINIPFKGECGKIHYRVIDTFEKYNIYPKTYKDFLLKTLTSIENPSDDYRTGSILGYFQSDKTVDNTEWTTGLTTIQRATKRYFYSYLRLLINARYEKQKTVEKRIDTIVALGKKKKIGRPVVFDNPFIFYSLVYAIKYHYRYRQEPVLYLLHRYHHLAAKNDSMTHTMYNVLTEIYKNDTVPEKNKTAAIDLLITILKSRAKSERTARSLYYMISDLEKKITRGENKQLHETTIKKINSGLGEWLCYLYNNTPYKNLKKNVGDYLKNKNLICR